MRYWLRLAEISVVMALAAIIFISWREDRRDRSQLAAQLAAAQQSLNEASARQHDRDAQLDKSLADLATLKRSVVTPAQILRALPQQIPLPAPITLQADHNASSVGATLGSPATNAADASAGGASPTPANGEKPALDGAFIPRADLKPLYDFALDCKACQTRLAAAQSDLADEKAKSATLTKERDAAVRAANGGGTWRRVTRAAKWFFIGAAAGAIAATAHH